jgi:hypothetical protein
LTISSDLVNSLPKNVREWQISHAQAWLEDVFAGAEDFPKYDFDFILLN